MAQQVVPVPNPKFQVGGLQTTAPSIVSHRVVKIPATFATTYTGQRIAADGLSASSTTMKFNIASNEDFADLSKFILVFDVTWIGPQAVSSGAGSIENGIPLNLVYDQSTQAFIAQITFGSPQGMKFEEIQNYNLFSNIVTQHTETSMHKEQSLLDHCEYLPELDKPNDLRKMFDGKLTFREKARIRIGQRTRIFLRFHHSSFLNNQNVIPLFLLRNGIETQILLESPHKMVTFGSFNGQSLDAIEPLTIGADGTSEEAAWFIGPGVTTVNDAGAVTARSRTDCIGTVTPSPLVLNLLARRTNANTLELAPTVNTMWLSWRIAKKIYDRVNQRNSGALPAGEVHVVPISIYELGTIVWSGFILIDPKSHGDATILKNASRNTQQIEQPAITALYTDFTDAQFNIDHFSAGATYADACLLRLPTMGAVAGTVTIPAQSAHEAARSQAIASLRSIDVQDRKHVVRNTITFNAISRAVQSGVPVGPQTYIGFPMYSMNDYEAVPYINPTSLESTPDMGAIATTIAQRDGEAVFHLGDIVTLQYASARTADARFQNWVPVNPTQNPVASALALWNVPPNQRKISYKIEKAEMLMRLLKPTSEEFAKWQAMFQSPSGIPIKMNSIIYRKQTFNWSSGVTQVNLPISVRSLKQIFFVIQDASCDLEPANTINALTLPNLSTFQARRLSRYEVIVGGQQYPIYPLDLKDNNFLNTVYGEDHIPEVESAFGISGSGSFNPSFSKANYKQVRNMLAGGFLGQSHQSVRQSYVALTGAQRCVYVDTPGKVFAMSLCKDEVNSFATGIDSSQSGAVSMNLYFGNPDGDVISSGFQVTPRPYDLHIFAICDRVVTLQEAANLARQ
jgi:hypothetical protein